MTLGVSNEPSSTSSSKHCEKWPGGLPVCARPRGYPVFPFPAALAYPFKGGLVDPLMRASDEHILIVRVPRAGGRPGYPSHLGFA